MSTTITCPACGLESERVRVAENTFSHECPQCDYTESLIRLLPIALLELLQYLLIFLASLPENGAVGFDGPIAFDPEVFG